MIFDRPFIEVPTIIYTVPGVECCLYFSDIFMLYAYIIPSLHFLHIFTYIFRKNNVSTLSAGTWNIESPSVYPIGTLSTPVSKMVNGMGKLWCVCGNVIKLINPHTIIIENSFSVSSDASKIITCMVLAGHGMWISLQNSGILKCYHTLTYEFLCEVNVAPAVTKMLTS